MRSMDVDGYRYNYEGFYEKIIYLIISYSYIFLNFKIALYLTNAINIYY